MQSFYTFLDKFDLAIKKTTQEKPTLYDISKKICEWREELTEISGKNPMMFMLLVRTCLKKYGFSLRDVNKDQNTRLTFYSNGRLAMALQLYNTMFLGESGNKNKPSPENEIAPSTPKCNSGYKLINS